MEVKISFELERTEHLGDMDAVNLRAFIELVKEFGYDGFEFEGVLLVDEKATLFLKDIE